MTKDEALDLALEALEESKTNNDTMEFHDRKNKAITAIKQALALDKMAENARALGLDYEPVGWWDSKIGFFEEKHFDQLQPLYTTPPAAPVLEGRDWSLLEATQESLREHMAEIKRLKEAQPAVPDALTSADIQEHIEYVAGWNDCRQAMLEMMK
jgi:hypothetical protein